MKDSAEAVTEFLRSLAEKVVSEHSKTKVKPLPSANTIIGKVLDKAGDSPLTQQLQSRRKYYEKLLELIMEEKTTSLESDQKLSLMWLSSQETFFSDAYKLSRSTQNNSMDSVLCCMLHTDKSLPHHLAAALISVAVWPPATSSRFVKIFCTRAQDPLFISSKFRDSFSFLLAFAVCNGGRGSSCPSWDSIVPSFNDHTVFSFVASVGYWIQAFKSSSIELRDTYLQALYDKLFSLISSIRKHSNHLDCRNNRLLPIFCILIHSWLENAIEDIPKKNILREVFYVMRIWMGDMELTSLWKELKCLPGIEKKEAVIKEKLAQCKNQFPSFSSWFVGQAELVKAATRCFEVIVTKGACIEDSIDDAEEAEIDFTIDGTAHSKVSDLLKQSEHDHSSSESDNDETDEPISYFLDKNGEEIATVENKSSCILSELEGDGESNHTEATNKRRNIETGDNSEIDDVPNERRKKLKKNSSKIDGPRVSSRLRSKKQ